MVFGKMENGGTKNVETLCCLKIVGLQWQLEYIYNKTKNMELIQFQLCNFRTCLEMCVKGIALRSDSPGGSYLEPI